MPRPKKIGLDYFPLDTTWDEKIKALLSIFGNDGLSWIITFWQSAYRDEFGRVDTNKYFGEVLAKDSRNTTEKQSEIIKMALDIKLIKEIEPGVYTSNGIQKRIKEVSSERGAALKRYYANKESTKERIKIPKEIKDKLKKSKVKDFGDTSEKYKTPQYRISQLLWESIKKSGTEMKPPDLIKWSEEIEKIHRIDKKPWDLINSIMQNARADNFWATVLRSAKKLREHILDGKFDKFIPPEYRTDEQYLADLETVLKTEAGND